jgi:hypothetical protein
MRVAPMTMAARPHRTAVVCALACALLASAFGVPAAARANADPQTASALAQEHYYSTDGKPETIDAATSAAQPQERYYASYGDPEPLTLPQSPAPADDTPLLPIALVIAVALTLAAAGANQLRRLRIRRRAARSAAQLARHARGAISWSAALGPQVPAA